VQIDDRCCYFHCMFELSLVKSLRFSQIQHNFMCSEDFGKLGNEYLNALTCKMFSFLRQYSETFDITYLYPINGLTQLSTLKNSPSFSGPPCTYMAMMELNITKHF